MATCELCDGEMMEADGCVEKQIEYGDGETFDAIPYGEEDRFDEIMDEDRREAMEELEEMDDSKRCHDCNAAVGEYHHPGCDWEECPRCGRQLLSCVCEYPIHHVDVESRTV